MTDTITDSFCERCGTRYTFEKADRPRRVRLGRVRVLTRGLTTFVANDGLPMAEAMAAARNDVERAALSNQLDAFHKTFNFCMTCRQYTCPSCWNEIAGECLTCAPDLSREVLPPAFPDLPIAGPPAGPDGEAAAILSAAWPSADLDRAVADEEPVADVTIEAATAEAAEATAPAEASFDGAVVAAADAPPAIAAAPKDPAEGEGPDHDAALGVGTTVDLTATELAEIEGALALARAEAIRIESAAGAGTQDAESAPVDAEGIVAADAEDAPTVPGAALAAGAAGVAAVVDAAAGARSADPPDLEAAPRPAPAGPVEPGEQAAVARDQTRSLLRRFRPGRGAATAAATAGAADAGATGEPEASAGAVEPEPRPAPAPEPPPQAAAAEAGPETTPEAAPGVGPGTTPELAPPTPVPTPVPDQPRSDTIQQPMWQMVAPDSTPAAPGAQGNGMEPAPPAAWPTTPGWSSQPAVQPRTPGPDASPWAARLASSRPETGGVWAASSREVLGAAAPGATPAVQSCVSCGLSLSATARFCRRCGARQG